MDPEKAALFRQRALELACEHYDGTDDEVLETAAKFGKFLETGETPPAAEKQAGDKAST